MQVDIPKDAWPGAFDAAAGGLLRAGESYADNAERELAEEIGVHGLELASHGEFFFEDAAIELVVPEDIQGLTLVVVVRAG